MNKTELTQLISKNFDYYQTGHVADYIPALAKVDPKQLGMAIYDLQENHLIEAGDANVRFAVESMSKVPVLLLAIKDNGIDHVFQKINTEPTGFAFNSIMNMEINHRKHPMNPFVNAGAIATTSLINGKNAEEKFDRILAFMKEICDDPAITLNEEIYQSESRTGDINRSLAYYMKGNQMIEGDVPAILDTYFKQCSVNVTAVGIAKLAAVLANKGIAPWNGQRIVSEKSATIVKSIMTIAGLYDESGEFSVHVGVPAKSGVGGGLLAAVPNRYGMGVFSPALDSFGNSAAGIQLLTDVIQELDADIFE
ncbi:MULTISPECIES: glutaminase A [Enterococcus]|uniref:Glutaminase n=1 Tax=Enterococcus malodoratus ATCC 43197 TaxID=1158601 RepID=R2RJ11_9ENTE|nr:MULTISPECIES: glutaminase A [Enterococcus]EOH75984.1 glutaminase A [Enterococcus malodoratus ATCC 43197]EOT67432.1 glutaminase A [Enterococcus malodoratus ATCC 43197]SPX04002.1 glutaminase [Enterococcus malodoratus]STD69316.1 glutaminase [Enterococcus malodoratus]HCM86988.1 glutaminase A [Enterococcus sp.]